MTIKLLSLLIFLPFFYAGAPVHAQTETSPTTTVEQAIERAKHYADKEEIDLLGKFIKKVEYHSNRHNTDERPYWQVYWINKRITKGGGVELRVYTDGSIEEKYYK